ncbi:MAG: 5-formyltetrahydrofolate cyclo-ligase [Succinivibrio sp.]
MSNSLEEFKALRNSIRQKLLEKRRTMTEADALSSGLKVLEFLKNDSYFDTKKVVASYLSMGGEISTASINEYFLSKHTLALPFMDVHVRGHMNFYEYRSGESLIENRYHILEPQNLEERYIAPDAIDALIVPLVGFDKKGNRLGMGGGYYDRMLKKISKNCRVIGIAYSFQEIDDVPVESWDVPLKEIITDEKHFVF